MALELSSRTVADAADTEADAAVTAIEDWTPLRR